MIDYRNTVNPVEFGLTAQTSKIKMDRVTDLVDTTETDRTAEYVWRFPPNGQYHHQLTETQQMENYQ